jgi:hypothetical protein
MSPEKRAPASATSEVIDSMVVSYSLKICKRSECFRHGPPGGGKSGAGIERYVAHNELERFEPLAYCWANILRERACAK